jgi:uncharacterized membrane protein (DUF106 family)
MPAFLSKYLATHTHTTHAVLVGLVAWAGVAELPGVQRVLKPLLENHPRLSPIMWVITSLGFLLLNPKVQARMKEKYGIDLAQEQKRLEESKQKIQEVQQDMKQAGAQASAAMKKPEEEPKK